ncbi:unnamed protein product [Didymodactylos carnosus]|uniref:ABC transporter domain-containing protein n=1 Tax=Didymodactylos carnosus TaxID=1234261 RepID=A0A8S2J869_9BILA|nr:unnamed protein product [Didymodactylos carnosus]CAF3798979.1 unnamed protein product [Didymodactylos carnosus]
MVIMLKLQEEIENVARIANIHEFTVKLPQVSTSLYFAIGSEEQRISIAPAFVRNREIVLFDEATYALDSQSAAVYKAQSNNRTSLTIAHRSGVPTSCSPKVDTPSYVFPHNPQSGLQAPIYQLFAGIQALPAMDKMAMSGRCRHETDQMVSFMKETFDFENKRNAQGNSEYFLDGVKAFELRKPISSMYRGTVIQFPSMKMKKKQCFCMTVEEIQRWQQTFRVYADADIYKHDSNGDEKALLKKSLSGKSAAGREAFKMKFVCRISQNPIFMEFDAKVIPRQLNESWPNKIYLASVSGIDFAGREHDVADVVYYFKNWQKVFELGKDGLPLPFNGRDFHQTPAKVKPDIDNNQLSKDLLKMARVRLTACDLEGIQIVVETGIGLGVFAGEHLGISHQVKQLSAKALKQLLEEDDKQFPNIKGVILSLPIFVRDKYNNLEIFRQEFSDYRGRLPLLIIDQDMHKIAVYCARMNYIVSELNPADSHGVFGEYWQNKGPAVEEKLALTTAGLLTQHHAVNLQVLDINHYHLLDFSK